MLVKTSSHYVRINLNDRALSLALSLSLSGAITIRESEASLWCTAHKRIKINNSARTLDYMTDVYAIKIISVTDGEILKVHAIS